MKHLALLGASLLLCSVSFGSVYAAYNPIEAAAKEEATYKKEGDTIYFGSCPQTYDAGLTQDLMDGKFYNKEGWTSYEYKNYAEDGQGNRYRVVDNCHANSGDHTYILRSNPEISTNMLEGKPAVFKYEAMKWRVVEETDEFYRVIPYSVYYTTYYADDGDATYNLDKNGLKQRLLLPFFGVTEVTAYFTSAEITLLGRDKNDAISVAFAEGGTGNASKFGFKADGKTLHEERVSDYLIMTGLDVTEAGIHNPPVWIKDTNSDRVGIVLSGKWYQNEATVNDNLYNPYIGVMPIIDLKKLASGGGSSDGGSSKSSAPSSVNGGLIVAIVTGVLGAGGLIASLAFLAKNLKKDPNHKVRGWYYAIIFGAAALAMVCVVALPSSISGGACPLKMGIYVQDGIPEAEGGIAQVGYTAFVIYEDGTGGYCFSMDDGKNASDFKVGVGGCIWYVKGNTFTLEKDGKYGFKLTGKVGCEYITGTNGNFNYRWVREA